METMSSYLSYLVFGRKKERKKERKKIVYYSLTPRHTTHH